MVDGIMRPKLFDAALWHQASERLDELDELAPAQQQRRLDELATTQPALARTLRKLLVEKELLLESDFLEGSVQHLVDPDETVRPSIELFDAALWREASERLHELDDLAPAEQQRRLDELATSQPALAGTLRELLVEKELLHESNFLEGSERHLVGLDEPARPSMVGRQIGAYTIEQLIGRGGMGEVWLASRSDGSFEGRCAIKFIDSAIARPDLAHRFRREGRLLARLNHPNIARLIDAGTTDDGRQFLVLEHVDGEHIDRYCSSRELTVAQRARLFLDAASAVAHAHSQLVIHRDLKPSNVLVTHDGVVKLLDFGVAKLLGDGPADGDEPHTRFEDCALTPEYAAPEQLLGEVPSGATDVYQLGMLLYVLLTGSHPLRLLDSRRERIKAALEGHVPRASEFTSAELRKELRGDLDAILGRALAVDPARRYPTAAALHDDLLRFLNHEPVQARQGKALYQMRKFVARHQLSVAVSATALAALCASLVFAIAQASVARVERDRAIALASRNDAVTDFLNIVVTEVADSGKPVTIDEMLARSERLASRNTGANPVNRAAVLAMIAAQYQVLGDLAKAAQLLERGLALLEASPGEGLRAEMRCGYAQIISKMGRRAEALKMLTAELEHPPENPASLAECLQCRAQFAASEQDAEGTLRYALQAVAKLRSSSTLRAKSEAVYLGTVARGYRMNGRQREAMQYFERSLKKYEEIGMESSASVLAIRTNFAVAIEGAGAPRRALQLYDDIAGFLSRRNPEAEPPTSILVNRGRALLTLARYEQSRASFEQGMAVARRVGSRDSEILCLTGLGRVAIELHDLDAAREYLEQAAMLLESPESVAAYPVLALARGSLALANGQIDEARHHFEFIVANKGSISTVIDARLGKSEVLLRTGDTRAAQTEARAALAAAKSLQGDLPHSYRTGRAWLMLGRALQKLGDGSQAQAAFAAAVDNLSNTLDADHPLLIQARNQLR
jgi:serine/threonine-protein kinase